ncbi:MAG: heparan-alpha-glucosaminide N-acetyltransferase domain-containing protein [Candidatus Sumerlaeaceae bacterium]|nr:heparan-alpha-glucosaminide N-acetyltransferase domain-containing protein [Candidatus Sumerlaeaceae bacterium]
MESKANSLPDKPARLLSLDVFRGATIAAMLLVNNAGDWDHVFSQLEHAEWHGCTATDLIFPFFLFIMGVAMPFSFGRRLEQGTAPASLIPQILKRALLLFALGLFLNFLMTSARGKPMRIMGVLERLGICYAAASLIILWGRERVQIVWIAVLLLGYYFLMSLVSVHGHGGGLFLMKGNLATYLDNLVFGNRCLEWDAKASYGHEPEGLLSTIPSIASVLIGCLAGELLRRPGYTGYQKACMLFAGGVALVILGKWWDLSFPMNKNIWTSSYVLFTGGWALLLLATIYWLVDLEGRAGWTKPFVVYGMNAITAYVGASAMAYTSIWIKWAGPDGKMISLKGWIYNHCYKSWIPSIAGDYVCSAAYGMSYVVLWCAIMWILYRKQIFLKV